MELVSRHFVLIPNIFGVTERSQPHFIGLIALANPIMLHKVTPEITPLQDSTAKPGSTPCFNISRPLSLYDVTAIMWLSDGKRK